MIAEILAFSFITALASSWHGGNHHSKGYIVAVHTFLALLINPVCVLSTALFWVAFRRKKQAVAELDYMSGKADIEAVKKAYPKPLGILMAKIMLWVQSNKLPVFDDIPLRRKQELTGGFVLGAICSAPLIVMESFAGSISWLVYA